MVGDEESLNRKITAISSTFRVAATAVALTDVVLWDSTGLED
jgi:hypothetical protein